VTSRWKLPSNAFAVPPKTRPTHRISKDAAFTSVDQVPTALKRLRQQVQTSQVLSGMIALNQLRSAMLGSIQRQALTRQRQRVETSQVFDRAKILYIP
jgi:hypothetical protein